MNKQEVFIAAERKFAYQPENNKPVSSFYGEYTFSKRRCGPAPERGV